MCFGGVLGVVSALVDFVGEVTRLDRDDQQPKDPVRVVVVLAPRPILVHREVVDLPVQHLRGDHLRGSGRRLRIEGLRVRVLVQGSD